MNTQYVLATQLTKLRAHTASSSSSSSQGRISSFCDAAARLKASINVHAPSVPALMSEETRIPPTRP